VKSQPATKRDVLVGSPPGTPGGGGGGTPRGGRIPLPGLPKMDWRGHIGYTQNPQ